MPNKRSKKTQRFYKMKGCSKKTCKNYLGGSADVNLAYPSNNVPTVPNPFLAYTGKGGACNSNLTPSLAIPVNTNAANKTLPNTGPVNVGGLGTPFLNPIGAQLGGSCGSCGLIKGGGNKHRIGCKCSSCKMTGGNPGIPYPNGLVGSSWTPSTNGWPGVDGIQGSRNFLAPNNYHTDVQTSIISTGSQPPFSIGGKRTKLGKPVKTRKNKINPRNLINTRNLRGGTVSNFLGQDLINLGRQFQFGLGSAYNALAGYSSPVNPLPWRDQLVNTTNLSTIRASAI